MQASKKTSRIRQYQHRKYSADAIKIHMVRTGPWWYQCSQIDTEQVREEVRKDQFSIMRARGLTNEEREKLRQLISERQKRIMKLDNIIHRYYEYHSN